MAPGRRARARSGVRGPPPKWQDNARAPRPVACARLPLLAQRPPPAGRVGECVGSPDARSPVPTPLARVSAPPAQESLAKLGHRPQTSDGFSVAERESKSGGSRSLPGFSSLRSPRKGPEDKGSGTWSLLAPRPGRRVTSSSSARLELLQDSVSCSAHPPTSLVETRLPVGCRSCRVGETGAA